MTRAIARFPAVSAILVVALGLLFCIDARAQQYYDPGILQKTIYRMPGDYQAQGVRAGSFIFVPALELVYEDHDNIFYLPEDEVGDTIYHARPSLSLNSDWSRHALSLGASSNIARYQDFSSEDYEDLIFNLNARIDVRHGSFISLRAASMSLHEDRSTPDDAGGVEPTDFSHDFIEVGYLHTFNRLSAELKFGLIKTGYDDARDGDGNVIDNSDRDREQETANVRLDYQFASAKSVFMDFGLNSISYDQPVDGGGFQRDSDGYRVQGGMTWDLTDLLIGSAWIEYLEQDYEDPRFEAVDGTGFGMSLQWFPTRLTSVNLRMNRAPLETTQPDTSGYLGTLYSVRLQHELRRYLLFNARASYTDNDYQLSREAPEESLRYTKVYRADIGLSYIFNRYFNLSGGYTYEKQEANLAAEDHRANRYFLTLGLQF
ncbi:MAG: outer membrane beta-barrel protein [Xanthomonadales bacterium]|nr:outer membrane beta-barrel protein [Xanthomonadales bacterium]